MGPVLANQSAKVELPERILASYLHILHDLNNNLTISNLTIKEI